MEAMFPQLRLGYSMRAQLAEPRECWLDRRAAVDDSGALESVMIRDFDECL